MTDQPEHEPLVDRVLAWLRALPPGAEVSWYSDGLDRDDPVGAVWIDVFCTELQDAVGCNWVWTIVQELDDDERADGLRFAFAPDHCVYRTLDPRPFAPEPVWVTVPIGEALTTADAEVLNRGLADGSADACVIGRPGWSADQVTHALRYWLSTRCDRADLVVTWDPDGPKAEYTLRLEALVEAAERGVEPMYLLHPGEDEGGEGRSVLVTEQVMELLAQELVSDDDIPPA